MEYQLTVKWGYTKKISGVEWRYVDRRRGERELEGKDSEVVNTRAGMRIKSSTVDKETYRHRDRSTLALPVGHDGRPRRRELSMANSVPSANYQVAVVTPPPMRMGFSWPISLPWLEFQKGCCSRESVVDLDANSFQMHVSKMLTQ